MKEDILVGQTAGLIWSASLVTDMRGWGWMVSGAGTRCYWRRRAEDGRSIILSLPQDLMRGGSEDDGAEQSEIGYFLQLESF